MIYYTNLIHPYGTTTYQFGSVHVFWRSIHLGSIGLFYIRPLPLLVVIKLVPRVGVVPDYHHSLSSQQYRRCTGAAMFLVQRE